MNRRCVIAISDIFKILMIKILRLMVHIMHRHQKETGKHEKNDDEYANITVQSQ